MPLPKQKITFATDKNCLKSTNNPSGQWTLKELIIFSIICKITVVFSDLGIYIDRGELKRI
jgi:hypothetical protein